MEVNQKVKGFTVSNIRPLKELEANFVEMKHDYSGARLVWIDRKNQNKTFSVSFRTIPSDDTGVFHILEHSVLGGSEKYPVREPFVELLKSSVNTFLNAITFPDKTMYPVASRNDKDFFNLMEVYLDAVFHPSVLRNRNIFRQEGWHYEVDAAGKPSYQGIVFNEMKGAMSGVDDVSITEMNRLLFPDSPYRFISGGDPKHISELTHEAFCAAHHRFYHPSKAYLFLDGSVDIERTLDLLDRELSFAEPLKEIEPDIPYQQPVSGRKTAYYELGSEEDETDKDRLSMAKLFGDWRDRVKHCAVDLICEVLCGSNEAPLKKAILDHKLAENMMMGIDSSTLQATFAIDFINSDRSKFDDIRKVLRETIDEILEKGLDKEEIRANLSRMIFQAMMPEEPSGIYLVDAVMNSWLYGGDPMLYLQRLDMFEDLKQKVDTDYYDNLLRELFAGEWCELELYPSKTLGDELMDAEEKRLEADAANWTEADIERIRAEAEALKNWQSTPDTQEALDTLPKLTLEDLRKEPEYMDTIEVDTPAFHVLRHPCDQHGLVHLILYFDVTDSTCEDFTRWGMMLSLLGKLPTKKHDVLTLRRLMKINIGKFSCTLKPCDDKTGCKGYVQIRLSLLEDKVENALELLREILFETDFNQPEKISTILKQQMENYRQTLVSYGYVFARIHAGAHFYPSIMMGECAHGLLSYQYVQQFSRDFDAEMVRFAAWCGDACQKAFGTKRLLCSIAAPMTTPIPSLEKMLPAGTACLSASFTETLAGPLCEGIAVPAQVSSGVCVTDLRSEMKKLNGSMLVMTHILTYEYLWNEVRVKGGAYGTGSSLSNIGSMTDYSFRDPTPEKTISIFQGKSDYLRKMMKEAPAFDRYIIGTIGDLEPELSPVSQANSADNEYLQGESNGHRLQLRREAININVQDVLDFCTLLDKCAGQIAVCYFGPEKALLACKDMNITKM